MDLIKLCPACSEENPIFEVVCRVCMTNLSSVSPTPKGAAPKAEETPSNRSDTTTVSALPPVLTLMRGDGRPVPAAEGSELGRSGEYDELFRDIKTVSRRHAKISRDSNVWQIEDLGSTNGTWVNGKRLVEGLPYPLRAGDIVALSLSCELRVME